MKNVLHTILFLLLALASMPAAALEAGTIEVAGAARSYVFVVPQNLRRPAPLLLALHGGGGEGRGMAVLSEFAELAAEKGFIAVFPDGLGHQWNDGRDVASGADDVAFLGALIERFVSRHGADGRRVYAAGMANGGMMGFRLACEMPGRIAAISAVAANLPQTLAERCSAGVPLPVMIVNGTEDPLVPWAGGEVKGGRGALLSAPATAALFAARLGRPSGTVEPMPAFAVNDPTRVRRHRWKAGGAEVVLFEIEGGGHAWPGGAQSLPEGFAGRVSRQLDASREIADFLLRFRLR
jgi:polyhydroxybutyrate depolymerase